MLSAEEAKARLTTLQDPEWRAKAERRVAKLPRRLREPTGAFLAPEPDWSVQNKTQEHWDRQLAAAGALDGMPDEHRAQIMDALHPGLGPALVRWWADAQDRPYLRGWDRKAFRAAGSPGLTVAGRATDLARLVGLAGPYEADPVWLAVWGGHLAAQDRRWPLSPVTLGGLLASAIDLGGRTGEETLAALIEVGNGEHPAGIMGRHVIVALLGSSRREGWEFVERMLLAAQRQEGLRQSILEAADEGHPGAFDRMLAVVLDNRLLRFAASVRAAGVWLGFGGSVGDIPLVEERVRKLAAFRASDAERTAALAGTDPWDVYIALCARGMRDVLGTIPEVRQLAGAPSADLRAAALRYVSATNLTEGQHLLAAAVDDGDIRVASLAASLLQPAGLKLPDTFDALARLVPRLPGKPRQETGLGVEQLPVTVSQPETAGRLVRALGKRPVADLLPWLPVMDPGGRSMVASLISGEAWWTTRKQELTAELRPVMIGLLSDRSSQVRGTAIRALTKTRLAPSEAPAVEALLTRAATDIRRGALTLLASLPRDAARASATRLAASADKRQRDAAAELLREIGGSAEPGADLHVTLAAARTSPSLPRRPAARWRPDGRAGQVIMALGDLAAQHRDVPVTISSWQGSQEMLFGDIQHFPWPFRNALGGMPTGGMVLGGVFRGWWTGRPGALRGGDDGLDALRAYVLAALSDPRRPAGPFARDSNDWWQAVLRQLAGDLPEDLPQRIAVRHVTSWLVAEHANGKVIDECLDALEITLAAVPTDALTAAPASDPHMIFRTPGVLPHTDWRTRLTGHPWHALLGGLLQTRPDLFAPWQIQRWYRLMRWVEQPTPRAELHPVTDGLLVAAHGAGAASDDDVAVAFLHPRDLLFKALTRRWRSQLEARHPAIAQIADRVRDQVVAVELQRGDLPTPTSPTAMNIASVSGVQLVAQLLRKLGTAPLARGWRWSSDSRDDVLSHLVRVSFPAAGESGFDLKAAADEAGVTAQRLVDLALYAPQWAVPVEEALGWPGLADGVLWLHAHTKDRQWMVDQELRDSWAAMTAERTSLSAEDLMDGAVDVDWFRRGHSALGGERYAVLHKAARHASGGNGHRRAQLFAEAMLGQLDEADLTTRITKRRHQDAVRALGLLPLPSGAAA